MPNHSLNNTTFPSLNVYLKSEEASLSFSSSHKQFNLKTQINQSKRPDVQTLVGLTNFECPYTFYLVNKNNNNLGIKVGGVETNITITHGNYDIYSLLSEIETKLFEKATILNCIVTTTFSESTQKITFVSSNSNSIGFLETTTCDRILGLEGSLPTPNADLSLNFTCPNCCNLSGTSSIYIKLRGLGLQNLNSKGEPDETISKINVEVLPSNFIFYEDEAENIYYLIDNSIIKTLEIQLLDDEGNEIDFNGGFFSMVLTFHFAYRREEIFNPNAFLYTPKFSIKETKK